MERYCSTDQSSQRTLAPTEEEEDKEDKEEEEEDKEDKEEDSSAPLVVDSEKCRGIIRQTKAHSGL